MFSDGVDQVGEVLTGLDVLGLGVVVVDGVVVLGVVVRVGLALPELDDDHVGQVELLDGQVGQVGSVVDDQVG
ncbi:hypothetical protein LV75_000591 [Actinokineospora diospyrosa]|uniref:Uncharacterized protein n=1 Tax=Actinokineospora diospyrosa TaxID=103728 RepID=A0ABT1I646_9PSEU|nr:hypothetical protein [Actinokineospora diospyrosa]